MINEFSRWNLLLLQTYFSPDNKGQRVWLSTTRDELDKIGDRFGGADQLVEAVKSGPSWACGNGNIADKAAILAKQRKQQKKPAGYCDPASLDETYTGYNAPVYLPYLALWVLAKSEEGKAGFYAKVSELLGGADFPDGARETMLEVWKDLECWSELKTRMNFGHFKADVLGAHRFVGLAAAQAMITAADWDDISRLFSICGLRPGQMLDENTFASLLAQGRHANYIGANLKAAMNNDGFHEPLKEKLGEHLEFFWNGQAPKRKNNRAGFQGARPAQTSREQYEASIILKWDANDDGESFWQIGWRVPAVVSSSGGYAIKAGDGAENKAKLELAGTHIHCINGVNQTDARRIIDHSAREPVGITLSYNNMDGGSSERQFYLGKEGGKEKLRVLVWDAPDPALRHTLVERDMPLAGPAYLFCSNTYYENLRSLLQDPDVNVEEINFPGLPDDWRLLCIAQVATLSTKQRADILDEEESSRKQAKIRFVGGKIVSGAGMQSYLAYDLPIIEMEAPLGAVLLADGLELWELTVVATENRACNILPDSLAASPIRRFCFPKNGVPGGAYRFRVMRGDEELCRRGIKITTPIGMQVKHRDDFSIDRFGFPQTGSDGLFGASIGNRQGSNVRITINPFWTEEASRRSWLREGVNEILESNISCQFLDSVATFGAITYGPTRDQIRRLASNKGIDDVDIFALLQSLRKRGHIEIDTDQQGHIVRICAVPPTLYKLPVCLPDGVPLYGVCGSLKLQHWRELAGAQGISLLLEQGDEIGLPALRLAIGDQDVIAALVQRAGFKVVDDCPARQILPWLGSLQELKSGLSWYPEQRDNPALLKKLNSAKGIFSHSNNMSVDANFCYEIFKYEDPQVRGLPVYKLGWNGGDGITKYSFIRDSRWGVWMTINAFAETLARPPFNNHEASPWPFHYEPLQGCLWVPARIDFPYVIARVLCLCAGSGPLVFSTKGAADGGAIRLCQEDGTFIGNVSLVYNEMIDGKWLCYRWVPGSVANHVAGLLNGVIKEI